MKKRIVSLFLALVMALSLIPTTVWAETASGSENRGKVHVIVENTVYKVTTDADLWNGTLVNTDVTLNAEVNTMMDCIVSALATEGYTAVGAESNYISKITHGGKELGEFDGGSGSGWMGTLNDWFTNRGFGEFTAVDGDEIRVMYTRDGGKDIGGDWTTMNDTSLTALSFSAGELTPAFNKDTHAYTLKLPEKDNQVTVTAAAANKQNQVYLSVGNAEYRRTAAIPMVHGTVLTIRCGDTKEASGEGENATPAVTPTTYTVTVKAPHVPAVPTAEVTIRSQMAGGYLHGFAEKQTVSYDLAEKYGYTDDVDGVSALDVLVRAHQLTYGEAFTKETAKDFLVVGSSGWISTIFGTATYASGFYLNQGYPNDGTPASYGGGYNGTFTTNTKVNDGDVLDFYVMEDDSSYSDYYTWLENVPDKMVDGDKVTVTVKGFYAMSGYLHKTPADLKAAAKPLEGVQLAWVDPATGAVTKIENAITDEDGKATFTVDKETATGTLAAVSYGDAEEYERVYTIMNTSVQAPVYDEGSVEVVFTGLHNAQLKDIKVYAYANGSKTGENLLADESRIVDGYGYKRETKLIPGDYWVEGYDENGDCNGSLVLTVEPGIKNEFKLQRVYQIYASNSGWALDEDYTLDVKLISADNQVRTIQLGKADCWGTVYASCIFVSGDTLEVTFTPDAEKHPDENVATVKKTLTDTATVSATCKVGVNITFDVPENSTVTVGTLTNYYVYSYVEPVSRDEATNTVTYRVDQNTDYFYRVQNPNGVTYWDYKRWSEGETITLTDDDLHIGDENFTKDTIYRFEKNVYDRADIYLNINTQGYKSMAVGETFELNSFRNWFAIESFMNAKVALPDMHYRGIDVNGQPSDVVTITPDAKNSNVATMTANKAGTAIVLVTYDAMIHKQGQSSTASKEFSAIWPECTGVFVVTVGSDGTGIKTNMILDRMDADIKNDEARQLDAEHDILFYLGNEGAEYSFKPESGCTVTVARSTVGNTMTFNGFTNNGVTVAEDGTVTVTGLTTGRHIIKVEKNGVANYQVVTARGVSYDLLDAEGNVLPDDAELKPGDKVKVQFHNLVSPKEKLSGAYNFNFSLYYKGEDGTFFKSNPGGNFGVYDFSGNPVRQLIEITIPKDQEGLTYTLNGAIKQGGFAGVPTHRGITYAAGTQKGFNAPSVSGILSRLPELALKLEGYGAFYGPIEATETLIDAIGTVSRNSADAITAARTAYDALSDEQKALVSNYEVLTAAEAMLAALELQYVYQTTGDYLASKGTPIVGSIGGEWLTIGLARSGRTVPAGYYDNAVAYVKKNINAETNRLDKNKSTDNARLILALTAISKDVTDVGGYDLLAGLDDMKYIKRQGTNGPVWTLIALDSHDYTPAGSVTRDQLVETILSLQKDSGAWYINSTNKTDDVDMTAMAIQSLAPYYETNDAVKTAVDKALTWLGTMQKADGSFAEMAGAASSSESTAQVLVALCAMGIDPTADVRFVKNSFHVLDGLLTFYTGTAFKHQESDATVDQMATEQSYYALTAYMRLVGGQTALYDMTDVACGKHAFGAWTVTKAATCTEAGTSVRTCTVCGAEETQTIPALGHSMTAVAAKAATCTEAGHSAYWSCSRCGKFFSDAAGKTEIAKDRWVIAALGHDEATRAAVAATCYASGHEADTYCKRCGMVINAGANIPATGKHTYVNGVCTVCGVKNPTANVKTDDIKVDSKNDTLVKDSSGLVIKAEVTVDDEKLMEIKAAVESGSITVKVDNKKAIQTTDEQKKADGGKSALEAKANAADTPAEVKNELTKLIDKLADMRKDNSGKKDAQIEKVVDVAVELVKTVNEQVTSVAQLIELPQSVTVTISITDEMYNSLLNRKVCVVRSHTDASGNVTTTELPAYLGGTEGNRVLSFQTDKASTFAIVSYETTSTGGGSTGGSGSITVVKATSANTADDSQMVIWLGSAVMAAAAVVVLTRKQKRVSK